ncbi:MAG: segregation/condensation protein A [Armatimonadota bacterium]|nr:segregation/condensation protein A [Armatimonadota bacterium]MDR5704128.1 segregation/condensation protein A [Armatimonadota bacterium]
MDRKESDQVKIPQFEGSLEQLLHLAREGKIDLLEIPLGEIAQEYLHKARHSLDLEEATHLLWVMASLLELKSRLLLPKPPPVQEEEEIEPESLPESLAERIEEYRTFKEVAEALRVLEEYQRKIFVRAHEEADPLPLEGLTLDDLFGAFRQVLERAREVIREIPAEGVTVAERIEVILRSLRSHPEGTSFESLFPPEATRLEIIVTFLALLELVRQRLVRISQARPFAPILLFAVEETPDAAMG